LLCLASGCHGCSRATKNSRKLGQFFSGANPLGDLPVVL
jgi:hypothetical protein